MTEKHIHLIWLVTLVFMIAGACTKIEDGSLKPPLVYRIDIQQGNVVDQSMINKLEVGMDKKQVRFIMGTPLLIDPFHDERWDYIYTYQEGARVRQKRHITLYFDDEKLAYIKGDIKVTHIPVKSEEINTEKSVVVPDHIDNKTLIERWLADDPETSESESGVEPAEVDEPDATESQALMDEDPIPPATSPDPLEAAPGPVSEVTSETTVEALEDEDEEPGFFSKLWDRLSGSKDNTTPDDAEVLEPELENR